MTQHVLVPVNLYQCFNEGPRAVEAAMRGGFVATSVRLRGGKGGTNQRKLIRRHRKAWKTEVEDLGFDYGDATYAAVWFAIARAVGIDCEGHGWLEAVNELEARAEANAVVELCILYALKRWGLNGESGLFGESLRNGGAGFRPQAFKALKAFVQRFMGWDEGQGPPETALDWWGYLSLKFFFLGEKGVREFRKAERGWFSAVCPMIYQIAYEGRWGAKEKAELGVKRWPEHVERGDFDMLVGCGRWDDKNRDGEVQPGEVIGNMETIRSLLADFEVRRMHHYVGNGASMMLAKGHRYYHSMADLAKLVGDDSSIGMA